MKAIVVSEAEWNRIWLCYLEAAEIAVKEALLPKFGAVQIADSARNNLINLKHNLENPNTK